MQRSELSYDDEDDVDKYNSGQESVIGGDRG